jgi:hypothetical protein
MRTPAQSAQAELDYRHLLRSQLGDRELVLAGADAICDYLRDLGIVRRNGALFRWKQVRHWIEFHGFPCLPGMRVRLWQGAPVTSNLAVLAWLLAQKGNGALFRVYTKTQQQPRAA